MKFSSRFPRQAEQWGLVFAVSATSAFAPLGDGDHLLRNP